MTLKLACHAERSLINSRIEICRYVFVSVLRLGRALYIVARLSSVSLCAI